MDKQSDHTIFNEQVNEVEQTSTDNLQTSKITAEQPNATIDFADEDAMHHANENLPKGMGISPRLFIIVVIVILAVLTFVMALLFAYRHEPTQAGSNNALLVKSQNQTTPETAIQSLNGRQTNGTLITEKPVNNALKKSGQVDDTPSVGSSISPANVNGANDAYYQQQVQAARSVIAVANNYHGPDSQTVLDQGAGADQNSLTSNHAITGVGQNDDAYQNQNMQGEKTAFLQTQSQKNDGFYLDSQLSKPLSKYEVQAGTIIPATLKTGLDSDLPGFILAQVSQNVYDSVSGNYLLIPQGTKVLGTYDSQVAYGQSRLLIAWSRLIYPNGDSFDLQGQPGVDLLGLSGLTDQVNNHYLRIFGSALLFSVLGAAGQLSQPQQSTNGVMTNQQIIYGAIGQQMSQTGAQLVAKNMNIQPTITVRPGDEFNILLTRDMVLPGPYVYPPAPTNSAP